MSNYSIRQQNTLYGFSETAGLLYLKLTDVFAGDERRAFLAACAYEDRCGATLDHVMRRFPGFDHIPEAVKSNLSRFFAERWRNNFMKSALPHPHQEHSNG